MVINHVTYCDITREMSTHHRRNQTVVDKEKLTSTYNDSGIIFLYDNDPKDWQKSVCLKYCEKALIVYHSMP